LTRRLLAAIALVLVPLAEARSQDEELDRSDEVRLARSAGGFASVFGITGMRELIEARVPDRPMVRGIASLAIDHQKLSFGDGSVVQTTDSVGLQLSVGGSFARFVDLGLRWIPIEEVQTRRTGAPTQNEDKSGGLDLAAKLSLSLGSAAIAPYTIFHFELGGHDLTGSRAVEAGSAFVCSFVRDRVSLHATLSYDGKAGQPGAFRFRVGPSFVPYATDALLVHPFIYLDGVQRSDGLALQLIVGFQARIFDSLVVAVNANYYLFDHSLEPGTKDEGAWGFRLTLGLKVPL
jgi:hypothetical protein